MATVTVCISEALLKRAQTTTGRRGKVRRFSNARDAVAHRKRL